MRREKKEGKRSRKGGQGRRRGAFRQIKIYDYTLALPHRKANHPVGPKA